MDLFVTLAKVSGVFALVLLNGFFVAAEFAIVKVRATQIEPLMTGGSQRARVAHRIVMHLDAYLSATQLGITVASLGLGWLGEPFVAGLIRPVVAVLGIQQEAVINTLALVLGFSVITACTIILGELAPKWIAIQNAEKISLAVARPLHLFFLIFRPFIWLLNRGGNAVMDLMGMTPPTGGDISHSEEELRLLLSRQKNFSSTGRNILLNVLELQNRTVREIMVPRTSIVYLSTTKSLAENMAIALESQFTRFPLCDRSLDNILGMIHLKDLIKLKGEGGAGTRLVDMKREMLFAPETMPLERILSTILAKRVLMAIAVDEYGGTAGLVTLENVLEELVGDIRDEFDVESLPVQKVSDSEFLVDGTMPLHDFARMFDVRPRSKDVVTVSGYVIQIVGKVPDKGTTFRIGRWNGSVEAMDRRKVKTVRIRKLQSKEAAT